MIIRIIKKKKKKKIILSILEHQFSTSEWFLKDHVVLETNSCWKFSFVITEINDFLQNIKVI